MPKQIKEQCRPVSIYKLKEWGYLKLGRVNSGVIWWGEREYSVNFSVDLERMIFNLNYRIRGIGEEWKDVSHDYPIEATHCNYGGRRYWFICSVFNSGQYCGRRVAKLYLGSGSYYFACRHCYDLSYASRNEGGLFRWAGAFTMPDLDDYRDKIKRITYKGKKTRKYRIYERRLNRLHRAFECCYERLAK